MRRQVCLFLVDEHAAKPEGGAFALARSHFELLRDTGWEVVLVWLLPEDWGSSVPTQMFGDTIEECLIYAKGLTVSRFRQVWELLVNPAKFLYRPILRGELIEKLSQIIKDKKVSLIWAEHLLPATLAQVFAFELPVVYSHHDWWWKVKSYRYNPTLRNKLYRWASRRHEINLVRRVRGVVSGSWSEANEIKSLGAKHVGYFPTTYQSINLPTLTEIPEPPRIVHLGGMQTTASRAGLQRFLEISWPRIKQAIEAPNLWVIGSLDGISNGLLQQLSEPYIHCTGYVQNLSDVLRPYDIHITPWEHNTGTRTRIPVALNFKQVVISTINAAACLRELESGRNCLLVSDLEEMAEKIIALWNDPQLRMKIGEEGKRTFLENFTLDSQRERFEKFITQILGVG